MHRRNGNVILFILILFATISSMNCLGSKLYLTLVYATAESEYNINKDSLGLSIYVFDRFGNGRLTKADSVLIPSGETDTLSFFGADPTLIRYEGISDCISEWMVINTGQEHHLSIQYESETAAITIDGISASNSNDSLRVTMTRQFTLEGIRHSLPDCESSVVIEDITYSDFPLSSIIVARYELYRLSLSTKQGGQYIEISTANLSMNDEENIHLFSAP